MSQVKKTACGMCAVHCGLEMEVEGNHIVSVRPDPDSPRSSNYCCRKGRAAQFFHNHPDRLNHPLKRVGDEFVRISWDQAFKEIAEKQNEILEKHGPRSTATVGDTLATSHSSTGMAETFRQLVGTQYYYNPVGIEFMGLFWSNTQIFGPYFLEPDEERAEVLVFWGSNSYVSHQVQDSRRMIRKFSEDPDRMVITFDPRVTETARISDMHISLKPGSDALLMRAMIALILKEGWQHQAYLDKWAVDFDQVKPWFEGFDIEKACQVAGVPYAQIYELCRILTTRRWGVHQDLGIFMGRHNTLSSYLIATLCCVCGTLLAPGGTVVSPGFLPLVRLTDENDPNTWRTVATNHFPVSGVYPSGALLQEILSDHPDRLRSVICSMSNPMRSFPDSNDLEEAFSRLDLFVVTDICMTETARLAHYVLPAKSGYEMHDFCLFQFNYPKITTQLNQPVVEAEGERKEASEVWLGIIDAMGLIPDIPDSLYSAAQNKTRAEFGAELMAYTMEHPESFLAILAIIGKTLGKSMGSVNMSSLWSMFLIADESFHRAAVRAGFTPGPNMMDDLFQTLLDHPEGAVVGLNDTDNPASNFENITHPDGKLHLFNTVIDEYLKQITPEKEAEALKLPDEYPMILSAGRHFDSGHNGMMRNPETYQFRNPFTLALNPEDGSAMGIKDGQRVRVTTEADAIEIEADLTYQTRKGYVMVPHQFGFKFNGSTYGAGVNHLTSAKHMDTLTGNPIWRYVPCRVEAI